MRKKKLSLFFNRYLYLLRYLQPQPQPPLLPVPVKAEHDHLLLLLFSFSHFLFVLDLPIKSLIIKNYYCYVIKKIEQRTIIKQKQCYQYTYKHKIIQKKEKQNKTKKFKRTWTLISYQRCRANSGSHDIIPCSDTSSCLSQSYTKPL